jgi:hypothetical protein
MNNPDAGSEMVQSAAIVYGLLHDRRSFAPRDLDGIADPDAEKAILIIPGASDSSRLARMDFTTADHLP